MATETTDVLYEGKRIAFCAKCKIPLFANDILVQKDNKFFHRECVNINNIWYCPICNRFFSTEKLADKHYEKTKHYCGFISDGRRRL